MNQRRILRLNGSPRKNGTSASFAMTVKRLAEDEGHSAEIIHTMEYLDGVKQIDEIRCRIV